MNMMREYKNTVENRLQPIPSYYDVKKKEREEQEQQKDLLLQDFFLKALTFYNNNYPVSSKNITWNKSKEDLPINEKIGLKKNLESYTEAQLHLIRIIMAYNIKEHNYKKMDTLYKYQEIFGLVQNMIPGGKYYTKIEELKREQQLKDIQIKELEQKIQEEQDEFKKRLEKQRQEQIKNVEKIEKKELDENREDKIYSCEICKKECKSLAGLTSHIRIHEQKQEQELKQEE